MKEAHDNVIRRVLEEDGKVERYWVHRRVCKRIPNDETRGINVWDTLIANNRLTWVYRMHDPKCSNFPLTEG